MTFINPTNSETPGDSTGGQHQPLVSTLGRLRRRIWLQVALTSTSVALVVLALGYQLVGSFKPVLSLLVAALVMGFYYVRRRPLRWSTATFTRYLNRRVPAFEESAGLWLQPETKLSTLQRLQRKRVEPVWETLQRSQQSWLPAVDWRGPLAVIGLGVLLGGAHALWVMLAPPSDAVAVSTDDPMTASALLGYPLLLRIDVEPPPYTQLPAFSTTQANVSVPEGATLRWYYQGVALTDWQLVLSDAARRDQRFELRSVSGELESHNDNNRQRPTHTVAATVDTTSLYYLEPRARPSDEQWSPVVHSIAVSLDQPPTIRVVTPNSTRVEIAKSGTTQFDYAVTIDDDYGITDVEIRASIAKGSGEGVKFRDARFVFQDSRSTDDGVLYQQHWDLRDLGMTPGDELYLFTRAYDNHPLDPQSTRSDTVVVRWLDEVSDSNDDDGLAISVMPEYFKSQRQIIIETEQLLADRPYLSNQVFVATSRALGVDQGALKERYGQYVGDEFGESEAPQGLIDGVGSSDDADTGEDGSHHHDGDGHGHGPDDGHEHEPANSVSDNPLFGSAEVLMAQFGHDHGAADIGPISRQSPVGLMKRALANMWDAELHLRLGDPETALPFERDALRYFDLARKAQRIYTQRLGFEPPPISEDRRLTGDLADVQSRVRTQQTATDSDTTQVLQNTYRLLLSTPADTVFSASEIDVLAAAAAVLTEGAVERPGFIRAAAVLTQLRQQGRMSFGDCRDCQQVLQQTLWSALPALVAPAKQAIRTQPNSLVERYGQRLQQLREGSGS